MIFVPIPVDMNGGYERAILRAIPNLTAPQIRALWNALVQQSLSQSPPFPAETIKA